MGFTAFILIFLVGESSGISGPIEVKNLKSPSGFEWKENIDTEEGTREIRLVTWGGQPTDIRFVYDLLSHNYLKSRSREVDEKEELIILQPGKTLWNAHPEYFSSIEDIFKEIEEVSKEKTFNEHLFNVRRSIAKTYSEFIPALKSTQLSFLQGLIARLDFIEPVQNGNNGQEGGIDAFHLTPLLTLKDRPDELFRALENLAGHEKVFPLEWLVRTASHFSLLTRLTVLMLMTHNHQAEYRFLEGVQILYGKEKAFESLKNINQIYAAEKRYWKNKNQTNEDLLRFYKKTKIEFINKERLWEVDIDSYSRVLKPILKDLAPKSFQSSKVFVPYQQVYHYYGAFIASIRMIRELGVSPGLIPKLSMTLGTTYKRSTNGDEEGQLQLMSRYYFLGGQHAVRLNPYLRLQ